MNEGTIQIIATIIGLILYYSFSSKNKKKVKPSQGPNTVNSPVAPRKPKPAPVVEEKETGLKYEPVTFEELLEQFGQTKKKPMTRAEREEKLGMDDEFIPATDTKEEAKEELQQYYTELKDQEFSISEEDIASNQAENYKTKNAQTSRLHKMLQDPQTIRDAFIMKEIFDRRF